MSEANTIEDREIVASGSFVSKAGDRSAAIRLGQFRLTIELLSLAEDERPIWAEAHGCELKASFNLAKIADKPFVTDMRLADPNGKVAWLSFYVHGREGQAMVAYTVSAAPQ